MLNTDNTIIRKVKTPIGTGMLSGIDFTEKPPKYQVKILKKDCSIPIQSPCTFVFFPAEELEEIV